MSSNAFGGSGIIGRRIMRKVSRYADFSKWSPQVGQLLTSDLEELRQMSVSVPRIHADVHKGGDDSVIGPGPPVQLVAGGAALVGDPTAGAQAEGHRHAAPVGTPVALGLAAAAGASGSFADGSHVHPATVTTNGDLLTVIAGVLARLGLGAAGTVLTAGASAVAWSTLAALGLPQWVKYTVEHTALQAAAMSNDIELFSLPARGIIHAVVIKHSVAFGGGGISSYTLSVGIVGTLDYYASAFDVFQAVGDTVFQASNTLDGEDFGAAASIRLAAVSGGANLDQSTAGTVDVWVLQSVCP